MDKQNNNKKASETTTELTRKSFIAHDNPPPTPPYLHLSAFDGTVLEGQVSGRALRDHKHIRLVVLLVRERNNHKK
jgi:hypothetical protein